MLAIVFAPYLFGDRTLLSSATDAASLYPSGARPALPAHPPHTLDPGAPAWQNEPWLLIQRRIVLDEHRLPLWDRYDGYGAPFAAAMQPQPFYPLTALLALHPSPRTYDWFVVARLFIAGWFAGMFIRLFADRSAAAVTAVSTALTGYYLLYYDMPHLSVDVMLPMLLWSTELVVRRAVPARIAALALASGLTYLGGMPESAMLALTVAAGYAIVRVLSTETGRIRAASGVVAGHAGGVLLGAIMLLPFAQYVVHSLNQHETRTVGGIVGLAADGAWRTGLLSELAPLALGPPWTSVVSGGGFTGLRGFFGCAVLVLALVALFAALRRRDERLPVVGFITAVAVYGLLKRFGNPAVDWTGELPLVHLINFPKYMEFCIGDAVAVLAGFGVAALRERRATSGVLTVAVAAALALLSALYVDARALLPDPGAVLVNARAIIVALAALASAAACALAILAGGPRWRRAASVTLPALVLAEVVSGYAGLQLWTFMAPVTDDPYRGAPYLSYLARHVDRERERIFASGDILYPEWAGAFAFADPRALNALYPSEYLPFVDAFLTKGPTKPGSDLNDRFTGSSPPLLTDPLVRRWMALSSVAWYVTPVAIESVAQPPGGFLNALWSANQRRSGAALPLYPTSTRIAGVSEDGLFEHPPNDAVTLDVTVPRDRPIVAADLGIDPRTYAHAPVCGGPVAFTLRAERNGTTIANATRSIDPKHDVAQRRWIPLRLDLTRERGMPVTLRFVTSAVDTCAAWAIWGEPRFTAVTGDGTMRSRPRLFEPAYTGEAAYVYRIPGALPRVSLFHRASVAADDAAARKRITDPAFDALHTAVVQRAVALGPPRGPETAIVRDARSDRVSIDVSASVPALLVQNDTDYPGWVARVDGRPEPIVRVDGLFRGVPVAAGRHVVTLSYESAVTRAAAVATLVGLLLMIAGFAWPTGRALPSETSRAREAT